MVASYIPRSEDLRRILGGPFYCDETQEDSISLSILPLYYLHDDIHLVHVSGMIR